MTDKIEIHSKEHLISHIDLNESSDFLYFLANLKAGSTVKVAVNEPTVFCKIEIFESEKEVFD